MNDEPTKSDGGTSGYYRLPEGASELGDLIEHQDMNFNIGNIFKAAYRLGRKAGNDRAYDLRKIIWFAQRELARAEAASAPVRPVPILDAYFHPYGTKR